MSATWTASDVAKLKKAIATGALTVIGPDGRQITYRSLADMMALLKLIEGEALGTRGKTPNVSLVKFTRD
jgi:ribosomal protein L1